jgi:hypothetical protein
MSLSWMTKGTMGASPPFKADRGSAPSETQSGRRSRHPLATSPVSTVASSVAPFCFERIGALFLATPDERKRGEQLCRDSPLAPVAVSGCDAKIEIAAMACTWPVLLANVYCCWGGSSFTVSPVLVLLSPWSGPAHTCMIAGLRAGVLPVASSRGIVGLDVVSHRNISPGAPL